VTPGRWSTSYIISDKPMTEEELIKAHAIDVTSKEGEEK
jgi:hypothetical protein